MSRIWIVLALIALVSVGCGRREEASNGEETERTYAVTRWSEKTELFMEYPVLVAGEQHRFAVHFTDLRSFKPQTEGSVTVELRPVSGAPQSFSTPQPSRPGIFGVDVAPAAPGRYRMTVTLNAPDLRDEHEIGEVDVYATAAEAQRAPEPEEEEATSFLKEQQWNLDFATEVVQRRAMRHSITAPGEIRPRSGGESVLAAPVGGRIASAVFATVGMPVQRGQELAQIIPTLANMPNRVELESAVAQARVALDLARKDRERAERLLAARAVPAKRVEEAVAAEQVAEARFALATTNLEQMDAFRGSGANAPSSAILVIRSPIAGVVAEVAATSGATVDAGQKLFRVVATDVVQVAAAVPEAEATRLRNVSGGELLLGGEAQPIPLERPLSVSQVIDPSSRTATVIFRLNNKSGLVAVGQAVRVRLFTSGSTEAAAVPESAIVDDAGQPMVFVQVAGESFARRPVKLGARESGYVQVEGVQEEERVVTRGAYLIRLAALTGRVPAHGHVH